MAAGLEDQGCEDAQKERFVREDPRVKESRAEAKWLT